MEDKKKDFHFWIFLFVSIIWSIRVFWLLIEDQYSSSFNSQMKLNEIGDFLAGSFSPLAFAWLAYGYWMQNKELKTQILEIKKNTKNNKDSLNLQEKVFNSKQEEDLRKVAPVFVFIDYIPNIEDKNLLLSIKNIGNDIFEIHTSTEGEFNRDNRLEEWSSSETKTIDTKLNLTDLLQKSKELCQLEGANDAPPYIIETSDLSISFMTRDGQIYRKIFSLRLMLNDDYNPEHVGLKFNEQLIKGRL